MNTTSLIQTLVIKDAAYRVSYRLDDRLSMIQGLGYPDNPHRFRIFPATNINIAAERYTCPATSWTPTVESEYYNRNRKIGRKRVRFDQHHAEHICQLIGNKDNEH